MTGLRAETLDPGGAGVDRFTRAWWSALDRAACLPLYPAQSRRLLAGWTERLAAALATERPDPAEGWWVGERMVAAGFTTPEALGCTVKLMTTRLTADLALPDPAAGRLPDLVEALASGFAAAVHDRALDAQEAVRAAAVRAQARAEQALREGEARFRHCLTHHPVTDLPNRTRFLQQLSEWIAGAPAGARLGLCCLGLDRFSAVNESLGQPAGDRLLRQVAHRLRGLAAPAGWLVSHLDTDQFAIRVAGTTGAEDVVKVADQALAALAVPFQIDDLELPVTTSAGVVEGWAAGTDPAALLQAAQTALHWAKADGRARWRRYSPERASEDAARYRLSAAMPRALRRGEFTLAYQPLVDLGDGRLAGLEALARWRHPEQGLLPAHRFVGLAEQTGRIVPLGNRLLARACQQAASWEAYGDEAPYVSVNVSAAELDQPGFAGYVAETLDRCGLPPHRLQLEVAERTIIAIDGALATLRALADLGVRIAVDDFGHGHASLTRLRDLPLHTLKLDASLAQHPPVYPVQTRRHDAFLATTVALGHTLGLSVTAKGIETSAHAQRMRTAGCDTGQGWHLGRPQPADEVTRLLAPGKPHRA